MCKMLLIWTMLFLIAVSVAGQRQTAESVVKRDLLEMIATHPDPKLRQDMTGWYSRGKFRIVVDPNVPGLACGLGRGSSGSKVQTPIILVSSDFFHGSGLSGELLADSINTRMEKFGQIYHEFVHLRDHLSGKQPLNFPKDAPIARVAKHYWEAELKAYLEEWQFLKRMGYTRVFIRSKFAELPEWEQFIRTVYHNQQLHPKYRMYKVHWDKLFEDTLRHPRF